MRDVNIPIMNTSGAEKHKNRRITPRYLIKTTGTNKKRKVSKENHSFHQF